MDMPVPSNMSKHKMCPIINGKNLNTGHYVGYFRWCVKPIKLISLFLKIIDIMVLFSKSIINS
uniref:Uncharacterized protein n=1 Tax=Rhizophora mucronata TaxID=61149 RepID=A0A2P2KSS1_RHIMU